MCNGAIYDENKKAHEIHDYKINALKEIIEDNPSENFLVAYKLLFGLALTGHLSFTSNLTPDYIVKDRLSLCE